tara:strand:- start:4432 stop:5037 length:606 start_codon:yes stop_codon:yes gene_type:complete
MTKIILVDKTGTLNSVNVKSIDRDSLYKKCGFKKSEGFTRRTTWNVSIKKDGESEKHQVELWAREHGNANTENKYDFPPPCDTALYFGTCCLLKTNDDVIEDLDVDTWKKIYEKLFGGFEDLKSESESEDELDEVPDDMKTKDGYLKDGFVVDSHSDKSNDKSDESEIGSDSEEEAEDSSGSDQSDSELEEECYDYTSDEE